MTKLSWGDLGSHFFNVGVDRGVFNSKEGACVAWNGLVSIEEAPSDSSSTQSYIDGAKYQSQRTSGNFAATIEAFMYPEEFEKYDGVVYGATAQDRDTFNLSYRTLIGNDVDGVEHAYQIHLVYNALATPTEHVNSSLDDGSDLQLLSWDLSTMPLQITKDKISAHLVIDTRKAHSWTIEAFEALLYGSEYTEPRFPTPQEVLDLFEANAIVKITDNGDGTWTAEGPDTTVYLTSATSFEINWPSAVYIDEDTYRVSSL